MMALTITLATLAFLTDSVLILPIVAEIERTKERIAMNGHFKELDALDF